MAVSVFSFFWMFICNPDTKNIHLLIQETLLQFDWSGEKKQINNFKHFSPIRNVFHYIGYFEYCKKHQAVLRPPGHFTETLACLGKPEHTHLLLVSFFSWIPICLQNPTIGFAENILGHNIKELCEIRGLHRKRVNSKDFHLVHWKQKITPKLVF